MPLFGYPQNSGKFEINSLPWRPATSPSIVSPSVMSSGSNDSGSNDSADSEGFREGDKIDSVPSNFSFWITKYQYMKEDFNESSGRNKKRWPGGIGAARC